MSNLRFASLTGADFTGANARGVDFHGANLTGANLTGANLAGSDFSEVNFTGVRISERTNLQGANFTGATIQGMTFADRDGNVAPVSYKQLADMGVQGVGLQVAYEKAGQEGRVFENGGVSFGQETTQPIDYAKAAAAMRESGVSGMQVASNATLGRMSAQADLPSQQQERDGPGPTRS